MTKLQDFLNSPLPNVSRMQRGARAGDLFGVELECEGRAVNYNGDPHLVVDWAPHRDGSLRDHHGEACEWVFNGPVKYKNAVERVNKLFDYFDKRKSMLVTSNRTSTHVHYNMGDKNVYQLVNMFILFTILEDLMDRYCGEDRRGNLFCLSSRHAEEQVRWMQEACFKQFSFANIREDWRYCSFNFAAINKFGTVEFRGMRGLDNREAVLAWLSILNEFCEYACYKMRNPVTLVEEISQKTPIGFIKDVFSRDNFLALTRGIDEHEINGSIYEGLRLVQMLCYRIGTEFDQVRLRGRDFWASFKDDGQPQQDIAPELLVEGAAIAPAPRRAARPLGGLNRLAEPALPPDFAEEHRRIQEALQAAARRGEPGRVVDPEADGIRRRGLNDQWFVGGQWVDAAPAQPAPGARARPVKLRNPFREEEDNEF